MDTNKPVPVVVYGTIIMPGQRLQVRYYTILNKKVVYLFTYITSIIISFS
jgi:hypothetical protein